jgi:hypothetical protein
MTDPKTTRFNFLRIEADLAKTFIRVALNTSDGNHTIRALGNARKALAEIRHHLLKRPTDFSEDEIVFLEQRCTEIESELSAFPPATHN